MLIMTLIFGGCLTRQQKGACVALQTLPYGMDQTFGDKNLYRFPNGPVFVNCKDLNYIACEAKSKRSHLINEHELKVNCFFMQNQIQKLSLKERRIFTIQTTTAFLF